MAARRSRTPLGCVKGPPVRCISLICAIPMATKWSRFIACRLPELSQIKAAEGRPFRAALARQNRRGRRRASAVLQPIAQPNRAALQYLGARQGHCGDRRRYAGIAVARVENAWRALRAVDGGADRKADLVDQAGPQKG